MLAFSAQKCTHKSDKFGSLGVNHLEFFVIVVVDHRVFDPVSLAGCQSPADTFTQTLKICFVFL